MNSEIITAQPVKRKRSGGGRAFHSRLEPFVGFIREQRQRRKTWQEIAVALTGEKSCAITAQGVHQFYRRHLRRHAQPHWEDAPVITKATSASIEANSTPARKPILAATPQRREFRQPNPTDIKLNDPTKL